MVLVDEDNNWAMQAIKEAVEFLEHMLLWIDSLQNIEQLMQQ